MSIYTPGKKINLTLLTQMRRNDTQRGACWPEIQQTLIRELETATLPENSKQLLQEIVRRSSPVRKANRPPLVDWMEIGMDVEVCQAILNAHDKLSDSPSKGRPTITEARELAAKRRSLPVRLVTDCHRKYQQWKKDIGDDR